MFSAGQTSSRNLPSPPTPPPTSDRGTDQRPPPERERGSLSYRPAPSAPPSLSSHPRTPPPASTHFRALVRSIEHRTRRRPNTPECRQTTNTRTNQSGRASQPTNQPTKQARGYVHVCIFLFYFSIEVGIPIRIARTHTHTPPRPPKEHTARARLLTKPPHHVLYERMTLGDSSNSRRAEKKAKKIAR